MAGGVRRTLVWGTVVAAAFSAVLVASSGSSLLPADPPALTGVAKAAATAPGH